MQRGATSPRCCEGENRGRQGGDRKIKLVLMIVMMRAAYVWAAPRCELQAYPECLLLALFVPDEVRNGSKDALRDRAGILFLAVTHVE